MSNIHTIDSLRRGPAGRQQSPGRTPQSDPYRFSGSARTLDGQYIPPTRVEPEGPSTTPLGPLTENAEPLETMPPELSGSFWSWNIPPDQEVGLCQICGLSYCPCCVGDMCSETRKADWRRLFKTFTFWLSLAQVIVYIITLCLSKSVTGMLEPSSSVLITFGAVSTSDIKNSYQFYRLIIYIFLHGSILHIIFNLMAQMTFSLAMEEGWGTIRFIIIYFVSGILGGLFSTISSSTKVSVGASCAIFGTMGCYLVLLIIYWSRIPAPIRAHVLTWIIMFPILFVAVSFLPNVDYVGHFGGLLAGMGSGAIMFSSRGKNRAWRGSLIGVGITVLVTIILAPLLVMYA